MWQAAASAVTYLGDTTLLLLGGAALFFYLWVDDRRRALADSWAMAFGLCVVLTVASKLACHLIAGDRRETILLRSPSGHVAMATGFYGCCALMLATGRDQAARALLGIATTALLALLAASRLLLHVHTVPEVAFGLAIGATSLVVFELHRSGGRPVMLDAGQLLALLLLVGVARSSHVDGESLIKHLAQQIALAMPGQNP